MCLPRLVLEEMFTATAIFSGGGMLILCSSHFTMKASFLAAFTVLRVWAIWGRHWGPILLVLPFSMIPLCLNIVSHLLSENPSDVLTSPFYLVYICSRSSRICAIMVGYAWNLWRDSDIMGRRNLIHQQVRAFSVVIQWYLIESSEVRCGCTQSSIRMRI